jgi:hypothetical protein
LKFVPSGLVTFAARLLPLGGITALLAARCENLAGSVREERHSWLFNNLITLGLTTTAAAFLRWLAGLRLFASEEATDTGLNFDDLLFILNGMVHCRFDLGCHDRLYIGFGPLFDLDVRRLIVVHIHGILISQRLVAACLTHYTYYYIDTI